MISPNMNIANNSKSEHVEIGFDVSAKYYTLTKTEMLIHDGIHIEANKKLILTIEQAKKIRDDLISFFGIHDKWK